MSRLTGSEAQSLMEAYNAVYAPQELAEEQIWEQVENWVNSLLEEGYDLSNYTWEEMYESYLNEMGQRMTTGQATAPKAPPIVQSKPIDRIAGGGMGGRRGSGSNPSVSRPQVSNLGSNYRGQELAATARARASQVGTPRQGTAGGPTVGGNTPIGPAKTPAPAATPPRPGTPGASSNVKQAPTAAPATPAATPPGPPSRYNPLMQRTFGYQTGNAPDQIAKASAGAPPTPSGNSLGAAANPDVRKKLNLPSQQVNQSFDLFDVIKGHLLDEGYADNEDAALAIMANMSEEWKQDIVEGMTMKDFKERRRKLQRKAASDDAKKRGHVDKFTGKPYGTEEAASRRKDIHSPEHEPEREARRKFAEDPD